MHPNGNNSGPNRTDEKIPLFELSDEALEAAAETDMGGLPTLFHSTYCFSCPSTPKFRPKGKTSPA